MLFNSYIFILLFLPLVLSGYYIFNHFECYRVSSLFLLIMSLIFYAYFNISYLPIIISSIIINYIFYKLFERINKERLRKFLLIAAIVFNVGILFYFKYWDFFFYNINTVFGTSFTLQHLILPLGISFFTFQQLSFVIDSYKKETPDYDFINYALFVTYFPQLIAGPILNHNELIPQLTDISKRKINMKFLSSGLYIFIIGLSKKVLIADVFGNAANWSFSSIDILNSTDAIICMLSYTIQIYFDFSGYCDMATGIARMMNIDIPYNFNSPYKALTITDFWKRWHITLTRFFTKYIYIPLGGNRKGQPRTALNTMIVFTISGIWHGANWTFILWGILHGLFNVLTKLFDNFFKKLHPALNWIITFTFVNFTWIIFRADSVKDAFKIIKNILMLNFGTINFNIVDKFKLTGVESVLTLLFNKGLINIYPYAYISGFFLFAFVCTLGLRNSCELVNDFKPSYTKAVLSTVLLVWCVLSMAGISTFLYFNF